MKCVYLISFIFLVSSFQVINGNIFQDMQDWLRSESGSQTKVEGPLQDTGYWNFLLIGGIYGRMVHFLLTDTRGFGKEIKYLNHMFKNKFGDKEYMALESEVAESFPISDVIFDSSLMLLKVQDIKDEKTQKTLADALSTLNNIANDRGCVQRIVKSWDMIEDVSDVFKNPTAKSGIDQVELNRLKTLLLEHPEKFQQLLAQPDVLNTLSGSVLESLKDIDLIKGVESIQEMALLLKTLYPHNYDHISEELLEITDEQSGLSFADGLETVSNVMKTPQFQRRLKKLLSTDFLRDMHDVSQRPLAEAIGGPEEATSTVSPAKVRDELAKQDVHVSVEKAESLMEDAKNNRLVGMIKSTLQKAEQSTHGLTPTSVSESFEAEGIRVSPPRVNSIMQLVQMFPPKMMVSTMQGMGIDVTFEDVHFLKRKAAIVAPPAAPVPPVRRRTPSPAEEEPPSPSAPQKDSQPSPSRLEDE